MATRKRLAAGTVVRATNATDVAKVAARGDAPAGTRRWRMIAGHHGDIPLGWIDLGKWIKKDPPKGKVYVMSTTLSDVTLRKAVRVIPPGLEGDVTDITYIEPEAGWLYE